MLLFPQRQQTMHTVKVLSITTFVSKILWGIKEILLLWNYINQGMQLKAGTATGCRLPKSWNKSFIHIQIETWNTVLIVRIFVILSGSVGVTSSLLSFHTVRNLHFLSKNSTLISPSKIVELLLSENSWKCCGFGLFSCWQIWFHEKNCQKKIWGKKLVKILGICAF